MKYTRNCSTCSKYMTCRDSEKCGSSRMDWEPNPLFPIEYMKVVCISERKSCMSGVKVGVTYYVKRDSIYMDCDGDAYGEVYSDILDPAPRFVGNMLLKHFQTVE